MTTKHVLFILTNAAEIGPNKRATGYFFPEVAHPYEVFDHAGVAVEYASLLGAPFRKTATTPTILRNWPSATAPRCAA